MINPKYNKLNIPVHSNSHDAIIARRFIKWEKLLTSCLLGVDNIHKKMIWDSMYELVWKRKIIV